MNWSAEDAHTCGEKSSEMQSKPDIYSAERRKNQDISELF